MIGIIGGTGLYAMRGLGSLSAHEVQTPYGAPSGPLMLGALAGREVAFLARHGQGHCLLPGEINFRANIWALKSVGVRTLIAVSAVGSLADYDSWLEDPAQHASAAQILAQFRDNLERVQQLLTAVAAEYSEDESRPCRHTLRGALVTPLERLSTEQRALVEFLLI